MPFSCLLVSIPVFPRYKDGIYLSHLCNGHSLDVNLALTFIWQPHSVHLLPCLLQLGQALQVSILAFLTSSGTNLLKKRSRLAFVSPFAVSIDTGTPIILGLILGSFMLSD